MAGMKRFVTYIYAYEEGRKGNNIGFAKVEIRGAELRMEIHMRGVYAAQADCRVYLFREASGDMEGVQIGEMRLANGAGDFGVILNAGRIKETPFGIGDMEGIFLRTGDDRIFMSRWREGAPLIVDQAHFKEWQPAPQPQKSAAEQTATDIQPQRTAAEQAAAPQPQSRAVVHDIAGAAEQAAAPQPQRTASEQSRELRLQKSAAEQAVAPQPQSRAVVHDIAGAAEQAATDVRPQKPAAEQSRELRPGVDVPPETAAKDIAGTQEQSVMPETAEDENVQATEIPMRNFFPDYSWEGIWEKLCGEHPLLAPLADREARCIQIELKDLRELPKKYWYLGNNSFLLHGFFNYRYLVVGKTGEERWFIGVPGIYQRQERVMAAIFGFPEFLAAAVQGEGGEAPEGEPVNRFGCWCRYIEE